MLYRSAVEDILIPTSMLLLPLFLCHHSRPLSATIVAAAIIFDTSVSYQDCYQALLCVFHWPPFLCMPSLHQDCCIILLPSQYFFQPPSASNMALISFKVVTTIFYLHNPVFVSPSPSTSTLPCY